MLGRKANQDKTLYCSFCGKSQKEIVKLIAGPSVFICNECVALCNAIIDEALPDDIQRAGEIPETEIELKAETLRAALSKYHREVRFMIRRVQEESDPTNLPEDRDK